MGWPFAARQLSPAVRTSLYYLTFYSTNAVATPFLAIWLAQQGLSHEQIGMINAVPFLVMVVFNLVVGRLADRASDWRSVLVIGSIFAALTPLPLLVINGYWPILVVWTLVFVPYYALAPVLDAAAFRMASRIGADFGLIRACGTIGFIIVTCVAGVALSVGGAAAFVPLLVGVSIVRAIVSLWLPYFREPPEERAAERQTARQSHPLVASRMREIWQPWFMLALLGAGLLHGSHMLQQGFGALIWQQQGLDGWVVGMLWAVAPAGELFAMLFFSRLRKRIPARWLILTGCACGAIRWFGFGFEPPVWVYVPLQVLHVGSFALAYLGMIEFIANWTSEDIAAEAQSFFMVIRQIASVITLYGFGLLTDQMGAAAYHIAGLLAVGGGVLVVASLLLMPAKTLRQQRFA